LCAGGLLESHALMEAGNLWAGPDRNRMLEDLRVIHRLESCAFNPLRPAGHFSGPTLFYFISRGKNRK